MVKEIVIPENETAHLDKPLVIFEVSDNVEGTYRITWTLLENLHCGVGLAGAAVTSRKTESRETTLESGGGTDTEKPPTAVGKVIVHIYTCMHALYRATACMYACMHM